MDLGRGSRSRMKALEFMYTFEVTFDVRNVLSRLASYDRAGIREHHRRLRPAFHNPTLNP
jgi:hypothetical protein